MRTLCVDIGGTGVKVMAVGDDGAPLSERERLPTPQPALPEAVLAAIAELAAKVAPFDRISAGFPGVVEDGVVKTAPNLDPSWAGFPLAEALATRLGSPARVANDAGVQGLGVIEGKGVEMVLTLGTGMGCGLYVDGRYVPNLELAHHPFRKGDTYEEQLGDHARKKVGNERWNRRVGKAIAQLAPIFNYRKLYLGGGNTKHLDRAALPPGVVVVENVAGLLGGIRLWSDAPPLKRRAGTRSRAA
jgi:polyphosphate glucokinase